MCLRLAPKTGALSRYSFHLKLWDSVEASPYPPWGLEAGSFPLTLRPYVSSPHSLGVTPTTLFSPSSGSLGEAAPRPPVWRGLSRLSAAATAPSPVSSVAPGVLCLPGLPLHRTLLLHPNPARVLLLLNLYQPPKSSLSQTKLEPVLHLGVDDPWPPPQPCTLPQPSPPLTPGPAPQPR